MVPFKKRYWLEIEFPSQLLVNKTFRYKYAYSLNENQVIICVPCLKNNKDARIFSLFPFKEIWIHPKEIIGTRTLDDETVVCTTNKMLIELLFKHFSTL